jgi:hypothetical protein
MTGPTYTHGYDAEGQPVGAHLGAGDPIGFPGSAHLANYQFPAGTPTVSGDFYTISRFLTNPQLITRRLRTLTEQRFIGETLLTTRIQTQGGAVQFQLNESIYATDPIESVAPGAEFPLTDIGVGPSEIKAVAKYGFDTFITDEAQRRQNFDVMNRALLKMSNSMGNKTDAIILTAINAASIATQAASGLWTTAATDIISDVVTAVNTINAQNQGYQADTLVIDDTTWTGFMKNTAIRDALPREVANGPIRTGRFDSPLLGLNILRTANANMPTGTRAYVMDRSQLGGIGEEVPVTTTVMRQEERQRWRVRVHRVFVPFVNEPNAAVAITGVRA